MTFKLYVLLAKKSFKEFINYRFTSTMVIIFGFMFTLIELFAGTIYFSVNKSIGGFSYNQYQLMIMFLSTMTYSYQFIFIGAHESLAEDINNGNLDYKLIRPLNSYFYYALRKLDFPSGINLLVYILFTISFILKFHFNLFQYITLIMYYFTGIIFIFSINQIVIEVSFWKDNITALNGLPEYLIDSSNRPASIYPKWIRIILTNVLPLLPLSNIIFNITDNNNMSKELMTPLIILIAFTVIFSFISYYLWNKGLKHYYSAN